MVNLTTDSPLCRRIVLSFLDFLNLVEPAPGVDLEGLEVAKECLLDVFRIDPSSTDSQLKSDSLVDIFIQREELKHSKTMSDYKNEGPSCDSSNANMEKLSQTKAVDWTSGVQAPVVGFSKDELFGQFFGALEKIHYFSMPSGHEDQAQVDRATKLLHNAVMEMEKSGCQDFDQQNLADTFKSQGNKAMQSKQYHDAIELYTFAIALCEDNAVYYCNRAAANTQINKYTEAIRDCQKSIEIDPNYSKAYSRLGFAFYAQGNYRDAIEKGFKKALQLDPSNDSIKENIRMAEQHLREERQQTEYDQLPGGSRGQDIPPPFTSMPLNTNGMPADIASMLMNMATNVYQGQHSQDGQAEGSNSDAFNEPGIRLGGNISVNMGEQMPEDLTGALRSVMEMFTGAATQTNLHGDQSGRPAPS